MEVGLPSHYILADELGRGAFCIIKRGIDIRNQQEYAVKIIELKELTFLTGLSEKDVQREVDICRQLVHPHIVEVYDSYKVAGQIYVLTEILSGLDLCYEIVHKAKSGFVYSEAVASHYMRQVLEGLAYMHQCNILHRDMKPHNVMLASQDDAAPVKIGDFGIAMEMPESKLIQSGRIGTPHFMAPEVVNRQGYGFPVDVWGAGVTLYILLGGTFPFHGIEDEIFDVISEGTFSMQSKTWDCISSSAKELVQKMLEYKPSKRITAAEALNHPWLKDRQFAEKTHLRESVNELKRFNARRKLKGAILATMASRKLTSGVLTTKMNDHLAIATSSFSSISDINNNKQVDGADAVTQLVDALVDVKDITEAKTQDILFLQCLFKNKKLHSLMEIQSLSRKAIQKLDKENIQDNAEEALYEVNMLLNLEQHLDQQCTELKNLLEDPHVAAVIKSYDDIIKELQGKNDIFANYNTHLPEGLRVRLVQFTKNTNEAMGITLKLDEKKHCVVARIIHGGMMHRQGTLHIGDEIREINGVKTNTRSIENLQQLLRDATGEVTFKIVPSLRNDEINEKKLYVRCLFDYEPRADEIIPCQQAGISFKCGDVLEIVSKADHYWWQARREGEKKQAGLIPSTELQERRMTSSILEKYRNDKNITCVFPKKKKLKPRSSCYSARFNTAFDRLDLVTYEEVAFQKTFERKTLVLIGAHGVGRRHIKNTLITRFPEKYAYPVVHTSRQPKVTECNRGNWNFQSEEQMLADIANHQFLEYGQHEGALYGTKLSTVRSIICEGKMPVLDVETPALKVIRCKEFAPYIVFISSPTTFPNSGDPKMDASLQRLVQESNDLRTRYKHLFDHTVVNHTIEDTVEELVNHLQQLEHSSEWIPVSWMY